MEVSIARMNQDNFKFILQKMDDINYKMDFEMFQDEEVYNIELKFSNNSKPLIFRYFDIDTIYINIKNEYYSWDALRKDSDNFK
jgi:hypothetical protein